MTLSSQKNWYLLSSKPHKDAQAEAQLDNQGYEVYRPLAQRLKKRRGKMVKMTESLFPRYMFIQLDTVEDNWAPIRSTYGVNQIIRFGNEPTPVPDALITTLKQNEVSLGEKAIDLDRFHKGDQVILTEGPFKGLSGVFLSYNGEERAMILLDVMNTTTRLTTSPSSLLAA
uniref:Transcription/translation regulatory transformer protein RfaH n=1 Tax=uncultured Thiotrichaceae bacterium TaxID=298394 RepID=A0A6S6UD79_9GAMM|nr:MAG: Transcription/translation regulatory transformer protein RfaH [uncultured Thiotrichaceae bacterium]